MARTMSKDLLDVFCVMAAESAELANARSAQATPAVIEAARKYASDVEASLEAFFQDGRMRLLPAIERDEDIDSAYGRVHFLMGEGSAPYNVLMTLRGEGVGIWDGRWDEYLASGTLTALKNWLKRDPTLLEWADSSGAGKLNEAFDAAAHQTAGRPRRSRSRKPR